MPVFGNASKTRLDGAHPLLRRLMSEAIKRATPEQDFTIMDSQRGKAAQELAYKQGHSKARFGQSAHNWTPAVALDIAPFPIDFDNTKRFIDLAQKLILPLAKELSIPIRWGGDWNMDGSTSDGWDFPHYELHPWRSYAAKSKLFGT